MKKWTKWYIFLTGIIVVIVCIVTAIYRNNINQSIADTDEILKMILGVSVLLIAFATVIYIIIYGIIFVRRGMYNIRECDDELFRNIDKYKRCWGEDKFYYIKQIQIINLYYQKNGKIDKLIEDKEIERLYARADFLLNQTSLFDNMVTYFYSLVISVIASYVCQMMGDQGGLSSFVGMITIMIAFFGIFMLRYMERGQAGSYRYLVDEYERSLLLQKIKELEQKLTVASEDEQILASKQIIINELIRIRKRKIFKKHKEDVENDIKKVGKLDLCGADYSKCYIQKIFVNGAACCLVYDREKGKENNYIGELNLINQEYSIFYQILKKYDLGSCM